MINIQRIIISIIVLILLVLTFNNIFSVIKRVYVNQGKEEIIDLLTHEVEKIDKRNQEDLKDAKTIDQSINNMSDDAVREQLRKDFRDKSGRKQDSGVQAVVEDQTERAGHQSNPKADFKKQQKAPELLQNCFPIEIKNENGESTFDDICFDNPQFFTVPEVSNNG